MKKKLEKLNKRKALLEAEAAKISGFILRSVPMGSLDDLERWIKEEERRLQKTKDLIADTQEQMLKSFQDRFLSLQQQANELNFDIGDAPTGGWHLMGEWLDKTEAKLNKYKNQRNKESQQNLKEQQEIQKQLHDLEVFAQECGVTLQKPPFDIETLKTWIPQERKRVEREFQHEKEDNIREQEQRKKQREETRKKQEQKEQKLREERGDILEQISELKSEAEQYEDFELREPPNILEEAKRWLAEERIRLEEYRVQKIKEQKERKKVQQAHDELRKRVQGSRFSLSQLPSSSYANQLQWIQDQHQRFDAFLEAESKQPPPVQPMLPSQTKTISVDIDRPSIVTGKTHVINSNWQTSGGISSRSTVVSGLESLHNHLQQGWQIVSAVPLNGSFVTVSPDFAGPYTLSYTYRILYTLVKY